MQFTINPFTHRFDAFEQDTDPAGDVEMLTGNIGGAITPTAHNINITGTDGIYVTGTLGTSTLSITRLGYLEGTGQTVNAPSTVALITFALGATPATYQFTVDIAGFNLTNPSSVGAHEVLTVRTTGAAGVIVDSVDSQSNQEAPLVPFYNYTDVVGNNLIVYAYGSPAQTVNWRAVATYIRVV